MAKQYNIRWTENDSKQLTKAVRNFNAKVKRLENKYEGVPGTVIPEKVTMREMRDLIGTRRDLQKELKSLQNFTQRGSEELVRANTEDTIYLTKWQKQELERRSRAVNLGRAKRRAELESKELINKGEGLGYTRGAVGMGKAEALQLRPTKPFTPKMRKSDINAKMAHFRRESQGDYWKKRDILMRDNYIKALNNSFNPKDVKPIVDKIRNMSIEEFKDTVMSLPDDFDSAYPMASDSEEYKSAVEHLKEQWGIRETASKPSSSKKKGKKKTKSKKRR